MTEGLSTCCVGHELAFGQVAISPRITIDTVGLQVCRTYQIADVNTVWVGSSTARAAISNELIFAGS